MSMADVKTFKTYNFVTGAVDGTLAYDFSAPGYYPDEEEQEQPQRRPRRRERQRQREWIKEDVRSQTGAHAASRSRQGVSPVSVLGALCVAVLLTMTLLAQIKLTDISDTASRLEDQIRTLETERDKLKVEYETIFNLKYVEEVATEQYGMQEPESDQIYYLTGVASADRAEVVTQEEADMFSVGLQDLLGSIKMWTEGIFG